MSKRVPRKLKKACKNTTCVYRECRLIGFMPKYKRNTKWRMKALYCVVKEQRNLYKDAETFILELIEEKRKDYEKSKCA